ncbi:MAG: RsmD family RNA methyltransferase [Ignavibacteria bacterium]|nr:RsmD family RNA methyltransferase [Ignavibacteria bacterium]
MRIISGSLKGRKLIPPKSAEIRPTADRAKETLFNIVCNRYSLNGARVLELFCGSGAVGFECISRGAEEIVFVDLNIELAKKNAEHLGVIDKCRFIKGDSMKFPGTLSEKFDFIFADPPYDFGRYDELLDMLMIRADIIVLEHSGSYVPGEKFFKHLTVTRKSGKAHFSILEQSN